jgi:hypothetical protein
MADDKQGKKQAERVTAKFTVEPSNHRESAALLEYDWVEGVTYELRSIRWSEGCVAGVKMATVREVPVRIHYQPGLAVDGFAHWEKVGCKIVDVTNADYSFWRFWALYDYKVGNKARVMKKWTLLPEGDRILALGAIPRYKRFAEGKHIDRVYPETYIDQRRWENEYTN